MAVLPAVLCFGLKAVLTAVWGLGLYWQLYWGLGLCWGLCGWLCQCLRRVPEWRGGGGLGPLLALLPLACVHGVLQEQLAPAVALHLFLNLDELVLQLADDFLPVLQLLP